MAKSKKQTKEATLKIEPPKGRPMLHWFGKKPLDSIKSFPSQLVETFNPDGGSSILSNPSYKELEKNWHNLLFHGDNKEVLGYLLNNGFRGKIDLIYIDPPFDSAADYVKRIKLRDSRVKSEIESEEYTISEQIQYHDIWNNDGYLQYMYERLLILKELLSDEGSIYLHCDWHKIHHLRFLLDEVFGSQNFMNEIVWRYVKFQMGEMKKFANNSDRILLYKKSTEKWFFKPLKYKLDAPKKLLLKGWDRESGTIQNIKDENGKTQKIEITEEKIDDVWELQFMGATSGERTNYPTQKPERVLERVIEASCKENGIVLDCFLGSGTTTAVAQRLGRRWIGCDINKGAIQTTSNRLQEIIKEQLQQEKKSKEKLFKDDSSKKYVSFANYKVNDYDLRILRTEAIELAIEHLGIVRTKKDNFFEGMLGKKLAKIIEFNHPLSLQDLQMVQDELRKRPDEDRNITIVCLGKEIQVDNWISDYNKLHPINKIDVIELRTDSKYGKFFTHKPCKAKVEIKRKDIEASIVIKEFLSPTILERLEIDTKLFSVKIPDFRSMIDVVLIDTNYNGEVFNIVVSDVPEKKNDLVLGAYKVQIPKSKTTIAVKIIDMLGEELLIKKEV